MKLATYVVGGKESFGVLTDRGIIDCPSLDPKGPQGLLAALQAGPEAIRRIGTLVSGKAGRPGHFREPGEGTLEVAPLESVKLLAPIPAPPKIVALAGNYVKHIKELDKGRGLSDRPQRDTTPRPFLKPATTVAGHGAEIPWPPYSRQIDYEIELGIVMGAPARGVSPDQAKDRIAGYTIVNDVSARSCTFAQGRAKRPWDEFYDWLAGKWADGFCPMGPWLVTADEVGDPRRLGLELTVNGQVRQKASTAEMIFDVYEIVSFLSQIMTLTPGDVIATGTPSGVAMATGNFLQAGDAITCRIERIGELTNRLGNPPTTFYTPCTE